jgi:hypothetical protein
MAGRAPGSKSLDFDPDPAEETSKPFVSCMETNGFLFLRLGRIFGDKKVSQNGNSPYGTVSGHLSPSLPW